MVTGYTQIIIHILYQLVSMNDMKLFPKMLHLNSKRNKKKVKYCFQQLNSQRYLKQAIKKYHLDREIVPIIPSDTPTIATVSEHLDSEYW